MPTPLEIAQSRQTKLASAITAAAAIDTAAAALRSAVLTYRSAIETYARDPGVDRNYIDGIANNRPAAIAIVASLGLDQIFFNGDAPKPSFSTVAAPALRLSGLDEALIAGNTAVATAIQTLPQGAGTGNPPPPPILYTNG